MPRTNRYEVRYFYCREAHLREFSNKKGAMQYAKYLEQLHFVDTVHVTKVNTDYTQETIYDSKVK